MFHIGCFLRLLKGTPDIRTNHIFIAISLISTAKESWDGGDKTTFEIWGFT